MMFPLHIEFAMFSSTTYHSILVVGFKAFLYLRRYNNDVSCSDQMVFYFSIYYGVRKSIVWHNILTYFQHFIW